MRLRVWQCHRTKVIAFDCVLFQCSPWQNKLVETATTLARIRTKRVQVVTEFTEFEMSSDSSDGEREVKKRRTGLTGKQSNVHTLTCRDDEQT